MSATVDGRSVVRTDEGIVLPWSGRADIADGTRVVYGIRPGDIRVAGSGGIETLIELVEQTGAETLAFARAGSHEICATFPERQEFSRGQRVQMTPILERVHLFDAQGGQNLTKPQKSGQHAA